MSNKPVLLDMCNERSGDIKNLILSNSVKIDKIVDNHLSHINKNIDKLSNEVASLSAETKLLISQNQTYMKYMFLIIIGLMVAAFGVDVLKVMGWF